MSDATKTALFLVAAIAVSVAWAHCLSVGGWHP